MTPNPAKAKSTIIRITNPKSVSRVKVSGDIRKTPTKADIGSAGKGMIRKTKKRISSYQLPVNLDSNLSILLQESLTYLPNLLMAGFPPKYPTIYAGIVPIVAPNPTGIDTYTNSFANSPYERGS